MWSNEAIVFGVAVLVQIVGLLSVVLARTSERSPAQAFCQTLFFTCLLVVGALAVVSISSGIRCWFVCATTLPMMALGATLDLRRSPQYSAF
jgi:hypothetical protein